MPYGTDAFEDRFGDYKQPTVVDYDQSKAKVVSNPHQPSESDVLKHDEDIENTLKEILAINPVYGRSRYLSFTCSVNGKLSWDLAKIEKLKSDSNWLFTFRKFLIKAQTNLFLKK